MTFIEKYVKAFRKTYRTFINTVTNFYENIR